MTIGELYEKLGQLDGEQMQGEVYFEANQELWQGHISKCVCAEFDGKDVILEDDEESI